MSLEVDEEPLRSVIRNCRRLIADAELLLEKGGSPGSACSLAIMAFEEAGKGHSHELSVKKEKSIKVHSYHQFRHLISAIVMILSVHQKYGLKQPTWSDEQRDLVTERFEAAKSFSEFASSPAPDDIRTIIGRQIMDQLEALPHDARMVATVEMNWLRKMAKSSMTGEVERLRQKGFYVDFNDDGLLSRPSDVTRNDAFTWIWAAKRSLNLLAFGIYYQPYSELASILEQMPKPLPDVEGIMKIVLEMVKRAGVGTEPSLRRGGEDESRPYEPFGERPEPT